MTSGPPSGPSAFPPSHGHPGHPMHTPHTARFRKFKRRELVKACDRIEFPAEFDPVKIDDISTFIRSLGIRTRVHISDGLIRHVENMVKIPTSRVLEQNVEDLKKQLDSSEEIEIPNQVSDTTSVQPEATARR